jgi:hypothetical protein
MKTLIRKSINTGIVYGIVHIFFVLISFNTMIGILIAKISGNPNPGDIPAPIFLILYTVLMGAWAGAAALSKKDQLKNSQKLVLSLVAGLATGLVTVILNVALSLILINKIFIRDFLTVLSFDFIKGTLFEMTPVMGTLMTVVFIVVGSLVGLGLAILFKMPSVQNFWKKIWGFFRNLVDKIRYALRGKNHLLW